LNENYHPDNNGKSALDEVIDLHVSNTLLAEFLNKSYLATRWEVVSLDDEISTSFCSGSELACNFVNLVPSSDNWHNNVYLHYGKDRATYKNNVSAQIIYVDCNLTGRVKPI
jgi:hypothetical protein